MCNIQFMFNQIDILSLKMSTYDYRCITSLGNKRKHDNTSSRVSSPMSIYCLSDRLNYQNQKIQGLLQLSSDSPTTLQYPPTINDVNHGILLPCQEYSINSIVGVRLKAIIDVTHAYQMVVLTFQLQFGTVFLYKQLGKPPVIDEQHGTHQIIKGNKSITIFDGTE